MTDHTPHPIAPHHALAALTLLGTLGFGVWQLTSAARDLPLQDIPVSRADLLTGTSAKRLETGLEQHLPARATLIRYADIARYRLLHGAGAQVRLGSDDWLFLSEELEVHAQAAHDQQARIALMADAASALRRAGVHLIVALVPDKSRIHAEHLGDVTRARQLDPRYAETLAVLRKAGVDSVDLAGPLREAAATGEVYYRTDTHWNQHGAQVAAAAIAAEVQRSGLSLPVTTYATQTMGPLQARPGDLIRLMGLEEAPDWLRPRPDQEASVNTTRTENDAGSSLFGDSTVNVVLCGTSYSLRGNFQGYLQQALSSEVLNTAKDGGGFLNSITAYLQDEAYRNAPPTVLIWEVPERFLQAPLQDEPHWLEKVGLERS